MAFIEAGYLYSRVDLLLPSDVALRRKILGKRHTGELPVPPRVVLPG